MHQQILAEKPKPKSTKLQIKHLHKQLLNHQALEQQQLLLENPKWPLKMSAFHAIVVGNYAVYEGLFHKGRRKGPGVLTYIKHACQDVGWWHGEHLVRLNRIINSEWVPSLEKDIKNGPPSKSCIKNPKDLSNNVADILKSIQKKESGHNSNKRQFFVVTKEKRCKFHFDLEAILFTSNELLHIKRTKDGSLDKEVLEKCLQQYRTMKNTPLMEDIVEYAEKHLEAKTTYDVSHFVKNERSHFGPRGPYEHACTLFLEYCSNGDLYNLAKLTLSFNINPDLCDGAGNNGLIYATARDKVEIISFLANQGVDLDAHNDQGLTPLTLVLLRFIAHLNSVQNWYAAFMNKDGEAMKEIEDKNATINYYQVNFLKEITNTSLTDGIYSVYQKYGLHVPSGMHQGFQLPYNKKDFINGYVLDLKPRLPVNVSAAKSPCRRIHMDTYSKLEVIFNTLVFLLHHGAHPNVNHVSFPPIFLALFTETNDILKILLQFGADANTPISCHNMSLLHVVASMKPGLYLYTMAQTLLAEKTIDVEARTDSKHWNAENQKLVGNAKIILADSGKTPLHIISMRYDFDDSANKKTSSCYLLQIAELLIQRGASLETRYLGHVPLTLAMLRGNVELCKLYLNHGACANVLLGYKLGNPLTLFSSSKLKNHLPPIGVCLRLVRLLLDYQSDPLQSFAGFHNAPEFICNEAKHPTLVIYKQSSKKYVRPDFKFSKLQKKLLQLLLDHCRRVIKRHYQCLGFLALCLWFREEDSQVNRANGLYYHVVRLFSVNEAQHTASLLTAIGFIDSNNAQEQEIVQKVFAFVKKAASRCNKRHRNKSSSKLTKIFRREASSPLSGGGDRVEHLHWPELDDDFEKFQVCFNCCLRNGKVLLTCPHCGLYTFCSRKCEIASRRRHPCCKLFYGEEKRQFSICKQHGISFQNIHDDFFASIRDVLKCALENYNKCGNVES